MWFVLLAALTLVSSSHAAGAGAARLVCYSESLKTDYAECTHLVYTLDVRGEKLDVLLKEYRKGNARTKVLLRVGDDDQDLRSLIKSKHIQGLEINNAHRSLNRTKILETLESARAAITSSGGGPLFVSLPAHAELLAKYYDLRALVKVADLMVVETHDLGVAEKMTYHPSRLSGMWDMMNTDSVVDLVIGLGVPASKVIISLPASAQQFTLLNETLSTPGSPTEDQTKVIDQGELCRQLQKGRWTLERDQDLSAPYAFRNKTWISFEDASSVDVKGKYARVRGLAGLALMRADKDVETPCGPTLRTSLAKVLNQQSRAPRAAVLRSLEHEILSAPVVGRALDALQVSPYRITQVVDSDGVIHSIREDTRTEFSCSRQGYFVHPRTCARFYRCVKFDQLSPDYTVFEFDCPAGLAFDSRYEVCVWPGSLPDSQACPGSSEIAPVPRTRFICPNQEGYYADPENCRWFFACLDHGRAPLTAYEFRCPFGLGFDAARLKCDWPWLVPACGNIARYEAGVFGYSGAAIAGASGFHGQTADAINVAAHNSLVSGATANNLVGIQGGVLSSADALDANFIASQEHGDHGNGLAYQGVGLVQPATYTDEEKFTSGSLILDEYRQPTKGKIGSGIVGSQYASAHNNLYRSNVGDNTGAYVHDPTGDYAEPYRHIDSPTVPYLNDKHPYNDYQDYNQYSDSNSYVDGGKYVQDNSGTYYGDAYKSDYADSGYKADYSGSYKADHSGSYAGDTGKYVAGVYQGTGSSGLYVGNAGKVQNVYSGSSINHGSYSSGNDAYLTDSQVYTGASHTLAAGAVNVGLVGKTTLVDTSYIGQDNNQNAYKAASQTQYNNAVTHTQNGHVEFVNQPAVSINHVGTDFHNLDGYRFVTTPTTSGIPTTATSFVVTTAIPAVTTYKTTFVPEPPKTSVKQIFGITQPDITYVQPTFVPQYNTPKVEVTDYNQAVNQQTYENKAASFNYDVKSDGYDYPKPSVKFEDGVSVTYTTPAPIEVSTYKPRGFSHETIHKPESGYQYNAAVEVVEEPFKKVVAYTTGPTYVTESPVQTYSQDAYSHQTVHNVHEGISHNQQSVISSGYDYNKPEVTYEQPKTVVEYKTGQPTIAVHPLVTSTYRPQVYSHQTFHKVDESNVNNYDYGYEYKKPEVVYEQPQSVVEYTTAQPAVVIQPIVTSTYKPQVYSHQTFHKVDKSNVNNYEYGYEYKKPEVVYEQPQSVVEYTTAQPAVAIQPIVTSTYKPQVYSHQTFHKVDESNVNNYEYGYEYKKPQVAYEQPQTVVEYTTTQPAAAVQPIVTSTYQPQVYSQQTFHKVEANKVNTYDTNIGYDYPKPEVKYEPAKTFVEYATPQPAIAVQPVVTSTYKPQVYSQQTFHKVDANRVNTYDTYNSGYEYSKPAVQYVETPQPTYKPRTYNQQTFHKIDSFVASTPAPQPEIAYQPAVTVYENPILKYTQQTTPVSYVKPTVQVYTQTYQPIVQKEIKVSQPVEYKTSHQYQLLNQGYTYSQPEIQRNIETFNSGQAYSLASDVSHQVIHQSSGNQYEENKNVYVSTTPAPIAFENEYVEYEAPKKVAYKAPEYVPPKIVYQETYEASTPAPISQQEYIQTQDQYDYKGVNYAEQYDIVQKKVPAQQISFSTSHVQSKPIESYHISSFPGTSVTTTYAPISSPEIQVGYQAEEYLPPLSTPKPVTTTYTPTYSTTSREYLPPSSTPEAYLPPSTTAKPFVKINFETPEYLPPNVETTYLSSTTSKPIVDYKYEYISPKVQSTYLPPTTTERVNYEAPEYLPPKIENNYLPPSTTSRPITSTIFTTTYKAPTTEYKAPEYLPPQEENEQTIVNIDSFGLRNSKYNSKIRYNPYQEDISSTTAPIQRKQNIVVQTAKANLLGFGTVGPDAGLYSESFSSSTPVSSTEAYNVLPKLVVSSTYAPVTQGIVEVTPKPIPARRVKPKVAVVTKVNDFNPLLVRKLGAVCSCQSPIVVLRGRRPNPEAEYDDYSDDYIEESGRGDISNYEQRKSQRLQQARAKFATATSSGASLSTTTFNPIIVPDDSFYQDYQEPEIKIVSPQVSTTPVYLTTEKVIRIRPRVKAVTVAPTYKTVLLSEVSSTAVPNIKEGQESHASAIDSQSFDRYGPGGWRSRDETLQGSIDCQRAGLFRHPKQCNKFYACRWDCTKQRFTLHVFNCPVQLSFDPNIGACNWPSQGPACQGDTLLSNSV